MTLPNPATPAIPSPRRWNSRTLRALLAMALLPALSPAAGSFEAAPGLAAARVQFEAARAGSAAATARAQELFAALLRADAANPLYLAYYGSTYALQGRDSRAPWTRIHLIHEGLDYIDRGLAGLAQPQRAGGADAEVETRLVAIATFLALPDAIFHRLDDARRQLHLALSGSAFASASHDLQGHMIYESALLARTDHDSAAERTALQKVAALAPASVDMAEVRARLAELR